MKQGTCLLFSLLLIGSNFAQSAYACSCAEKPEIEPAMEQATIVFTGRVEDQEDSVFRPGYRQLKVTVLRKYKWIEDLPPKNEYVLVHTPIKVEDCGYKFQNGFDYLFFLSGNPAFLKTNKCSKTEVLEKAVLDEQRIRRLMGMEP